MQSMHAAFRISSIELGSCFPSIWNSGDVCILPLLAYWGLCSRLIRRCIHKYRQSEDLILQSSSLQHPFKNWHELRKTKLTASTFGGAIGLWPGRRVQLWLENLGFIEPFKANFSTCWNNIKEEEALERYAFITGNSVLKPEFKIHDKNNSEDSWLAASPDGIIELQSGGILEIKCPYSDVDMSKVLPWKRMPLYYMPQAQGLLEIADKDWMDFYVWTRNGSSLFKVYRDREYWELLKTALSDFWWNHVQPAKEICDEFEVTDPLVQLRSLKPEPRHELCTCIVYQSKILVDNSKLLIREIQWKPQYW